MEVRHQGQLILTDETLRVLLALLPFGRACVELTRARDVDDGGHLATTEVRELVRLLGRAGRVRALVTSEALRDAVGQFRTALRRIDLDALELDGRHTVSVFVWDPERDAPRPAIDDHDA